MREQQKISDKEREILEHATGWKSSTPGYRNYFVASEEHTDWALLQTLCAKGLMQNKPYPLSEACSIFTVTEAGLATLKGNYEHARA